MKNFLVKIRNFFLILIAIIFLGSLFYQLFQEYKRYELLRKEVSELVKKEKQISEEIKNLEMIKSESNLLEKLEKEARLMLGFKKAGEEVILVVPPKETTTSIFESTSSEAEIKENSFLKKIINLWYNFLAKLKRD